MATQDYFDDGSQKSPRYYQLIAINRTVEAIARGENRILLVMATGTGKTYTAFLVIWRLPEGVGDGEEGTCKEPSNDEYGGKGERIRSFVRRWHVHQRGVAVER